MLAKILKGIKMSDGGKGSAQRPFDQQKFNDNFEKIFGKKPKKRFLDMTELDFNEALGIKNDRVEKTTDATKD